MPRSLACLALLAASVLPACDDKPITTIDDAEEIRIEIDLTESQLKATLNTNLSGYLELGPSFQVTLNGRRADRLHRGTFDPEFPGDEPNGAFTLRPEDRVAPATMVFSDSSRTVTVDLGDQLLSPDVRLLAPADGVLRTGTRVEVSWSSPAELATPAGFRMRASTRTDPRVETVAEGRIVGTLPEVTHSGAGDLTVAWSPPGGKVTLPCNADRCTLEKYIIRNLRVTYAASP